MSFPIFVFSICGSFFTRRCFFVAADKLSQGVLELGRGGQKQGQKGCWLSHDLFFGGGVFPCGALICVFA